MKTFPAVLIIAVATLALANDSATNRTSSPLPAGTAVGRFQLIAAPVNIEGEKSEAQKYLFRIDTATGQVWRYQNMSIVVNVPSHPEITSTEAEGWIEISESFDQSAADSQSALKKLDGGTLKTK